ncbi:MAG: hypothetical protein ACTHOO_11420 [Alcanivorax sp.]
MGVNISTEQLTFINLTQYDSFAGVDNPNALDDFIALPVGEAQVESLREEIANQAFAQGVDDYEATDSQIRRILFSEQAAQEYGRAPDVTNEQMLEDHGPTWYEELGGALAGLFGKADEAVEKAVDAGVDATVEGVTQNDGMSGQAAEALKNRQDQIDSAVDNIQNGNDAAKSSVRLLGM